MDDNSMITFEDVLKACQVLDRYLDDVGRDKVELALTKFERDILRKQVTDLELDLRSKSAENGGESNG